MHSSKLIELIKVLDSQDYKAMLKFVRINNKNDGQSIVLLEYILKIAPNFDSKRLSKEKVFELVFPQRTFNDVVLRRCMSRLFQLCEDYVVYARIQSNEEKKKIELLTFYGENKLDRHFSAVLRNWNNRKSEDIDNMFFFNEFLVEREVSKHIFKQQDRTAEPNLQEISNNLDAFYLLHKLKVCCASITYQTLSSKKYELPLLEELLTYLENHRNTLHPLVQAYYYALLTLKEQDEETHFQNLKEIMFAQNVAFSSDEQADLFSLSQNYCIRKVNKGQREYLTELLELYKVGLDKGIVIENGILSPLDYKNIVTLGTRLKEFDWTEIFIETYVNNLDEVFRESAYHYNLARLYFSKREFKKVITLLHQVEHREIFVSLDVKVMLLKTYFELEEFEALSSLTESFRMFLSRKKNLGYHKNRYQNFLKFLRHLIRLQNFIKAEREAFKAEVLATKELIEKDWFLEKVTKE